MKDVEVALASISDIEWDTLCRVDPYNNHGNLPSEAYSFLVNFRIKPKYWSIDEKETGLLLLSKNDMSGKVITFPRHLVYYIEGPRCLAKNHVKLELKQVVYPSGTVPVLAID